jgi:hypothetical protein
MAVEGLQAGGAVLGLVDFTRAEAVQQLVHDAPHVHVVVNDEKAQAMEFDADHGAVPPHETLAQALAHLYRAALIFR